VFPGERRPRPGHPDAAAEQPTASLHTIQHTGWASPDADQRDSNRQLRPGAPDGHIDAIDVSLPESQWVQAQPRHPVVKAFNTIRPASLAKIGKTAGAAGRAVIPVAGDDPGAKSIVLELADQLGFDGLDAGPLTESWRQQPGTPICTTDLPLDAARQALADATRSRLPAGAAGPTAQKAECRHAPKQPHWCALRPGQPVRPQPPERVH
jgi:hypothetical protein